MCFGNGPHMELVDFFLFLYHVLNVTGSVHRFHNTIYGKIRSVNEMPYIATARPTWFRVEPRVGAGVSFNDNAQHPISSQGIR